MNRKTKRLVISLACLGCMVSTTSLTASQKSPGRFMNRRSIQDVALTENGKLVGQILDDKGRAIDGAVVTIRQRDQVVAKVRTNTSGQFVATGLRGGIYQIATAQGSTPFRIWTAKSAPPIARKSAVISARKSVLVRGQNLVSGMALDPVSLLVLGATGASAAFAIDNNNTLEDVEDKLQELEDKVDMIPSSP